MMDHDEEMRVFMAAQQFGERSGLDRDEANLFADWFTDTRPDAELNYDKIREWKRKRTHPMFRSAKDWRA